VTTEHSLWNAVIYTIFTDVDKDISVAMTTRYLDLQHQRRAIEMKTRHFAMLCSLVDIHPDRVRLAIAKKYESAKKDFRHRSRTQGTLSPSAILI